MGILKICSNIFSLYTNEWTKFVEISKTVSPNMEML